MPDHLFLRAFLTEITHLHRLPKVQVERIVGPLLGMFLPEAIAPCLSSLGAISGFHLVAPEFPLPLSAADDQTSLQSKNIDWLLVHPERRLVVLLELKTDRASMSEDQVALYRALGDRIAKEPDGAAFLLRRLDAIRHASDRPEKYATLRDRVSRHDDALRTAREAHTVWLVPRGTRVRDGEHVVHFADLPDQIDSRHPHADAWPVVREGLVALEESPLHAPLASRDTELTPTVLARHIRSNLHRDGETRTPVRFWFGVTGKGVKPNYQVEFTNGEICTYGFAGTPDRQHARYADANLSPPHRFDDATRADDSRE